MSTAGSLGFGQRAVLNAQHANAGIFTIQAAAHAATAGFFWLLNPIGSGRIMTVRKVWVNTAPGATAVLTPPTSLNLERVTFTGAPTGAVVAAAPRDTAEPVAVGTLRTASTGIVLTAGAVAHAFTTQQMVGAIGLNLTNSVPIDQTWPDAESDTALRLRVGEGIVLRQATAGAAALENRTLRVDVLWDES